jgi:hypothetical protein
LKFGRRPGAQNDEESDFPVGRLPAAVNSSFYIEDNSLRPVSVAAIKLNSPLRLGRYAKHRMSIWVKKTKLVCSGIVIEEKNDRYALYRVK